jgi:hypothetical protein
MSGQRHSLAAFYPRERTPGTHCTVQEAGWASELAWAQRQEEKFFACADDQIPVVQSVEAVPRAFVNHISAMLLRTLCNPGYIS